MARHEKIWAIIVVIAIIVTIGGGAAIWKFVSPPGISAFYDPPSPLPAGKPGEIIRTESFHSKFDNARVWRILYHSTNSSGKDVAASALLTVPTAAAPDTGYPLIASGHGTVGINRGCAPSIKPYDSFQGGPTSYDLFVGPFVTAGYAVVMADYQGLGTKGDNSYLVGDLEGRNILDAARAALTFPELKLEPGVLIWGQSQGGHSALFAGQLAPSYAPELKVLGVAAEAPAANLEGIFQDLTKQNEQGGVVSLPLMAVDAWAKADPNLKIDQILTNRGKGALNNVVKKTCLVFALLGTQLAQPSDLLKPDVLNAMAPTIAANTPGVGPYEMPLFIGQGDADHVVPVSATTHFVEKLCPAGNKLTYKIYEGSNHFSIVPDAQADVLAWMQTLRSGGDPGTTCAS